MCIFYRLFAYGVLFCCAITSLTAQNPIVSAVLDPDRMTDWTLAGQRFQHFNSPEQVVDIDLFGGVADGQTPNGTALQAALASVTNGDKIVLRFGTGSYFFNTPIVLPENIRIEGRSADSTTLLFNLGGAAQHCIGAYGSLTSDTTRITDTIRLHDTVLTVFDTSLFHADDYIYLQYNDSSLMFSTWGYKTAGQIIRIKAVAGNTLVLYSPLRSSIGTALNPIIRRIQPKRNIEIACLRIDRQDQTAAQTMNVSLNYVVDSKIESIESNNCNFAHIELSQCLNITVRGCYMHHAFNYGDGGKAYGTMLHFTTGECLIENNIFEHLRHSMITQAGANGNVFGYNYSFDPYAFLTVIFSDFAGDAVCHGNYPYLNLWEGNVMSYITVDNSHGANGKYNTFFRNRATKYGITVSNASSSNQNFIANDLPHASALYNLAGSGHFQHGNNNKGVITPTATNALSDISLYRHTAPDFLAWSAFGGIGVPNAVGSASNSAYDRLMVYGDHWTNTLCNEWSVPEVQASPAYLTVTEGDTVWIMVQADYTNSQTACTVGLTVDTLLSTTDAAVDYTLPAPLSIAPHNDLPLYLPFVAVDDTLIETTDTAIVHLAVDSTCLAAADSVIIYILSDDITGVRSSAADQPAHFTAYPNPTKGTLTIRSDVPFYTYRLDYGWGVLLQTEHFDPVTQLTITIPSVAGVCVLEITTIEGEAKALPIVSW